MCLPSYCTVKYFLNSASEKGQSILEGQSEFSAGEQHNPELPDTEMNPGLKIILPSSSQLHRDVLTVVAKKVTKRKHLP